MLKKTLLLTALFIILVPSSARADITEEQRDSLKKAKTMLEDAKSQTTRAILWTSKDTGNSQAVEYYAERALSVLGDGTTTVVTDQSKALAMKYLDRGHSLRTGRDPSDLNNLIAIIEEVVYFSALKPSPKSANEGSQARPLPGPSSKHP